jgi:putative protease
LKIEGRTKSHYYVARTAQVYRMAIDNAIAGGPFDMGLMAQLDHLANRGYTEGFYRRHVPSEYQNYDTGYSSNPNQQFVGEALACDGDRLTVDVKNYFRVGDTLELISPAGNHRFELAAMENRAGQAMAEAPGNGHVVSIPLPEGHGVSADGGHALLMRYL